MIDREAAVQQVAGNADCRDASGNPLAPGRYCLVHEGWTCGPAVTASVPPDREAAEALAAQLRAAVIPYVADDGYRSYRRITADDVLPALCQAREDGKAEGRRDAAEAIKACTRFEEGLGPFQDGFNCCLEQLPAVARGAQQPDEKERTDEPR